MRFHCLVFLSILLSAAAKAPAAPGDFNALRGYGSEIAGPQFIGGTGEYYSYHTFLNGAFFDPATSELQLENITLAGETTDAATGWKRLGFTALIRNHGIGFHERVGLEFETSFEEWEVRIPADPHPQPDLPPNGTVTRTQPYEILVPPAKAEAAKAAILAGQHVRPRAFELHQFTHRPVAMDQATDQKWIGTTRPLLPVRGVIIEFEAMTPLLASLRADDLLMEVPDPGGYAGAYHLARPRLPDPGEPPDPSLSDTIHAQEVWGPVDFAQPRETQLVRVTSVMTRPEDGHVFLHGVGTALTEVLANGSFLQRTVDAFDHSDNLTPADPYHKPTGVNAVSQFGPKAPSNKGPRDPAAAKGNGVGSMHFPFDGIGIAPGLKVSGEILFDALTFQLLVKFRNGLPSAAGMTLGMKAEVTLRIVAESGADNRFVPEIEQRQRLVDIFLPPIVFQIAGVPTSVAPKLTADVGVFLNAPSRVVIPFQSSLECGVKLGWDRTRPEGDKFHHTPYHRIRPLGISKPTLGDSLAMSMGAFAQTNLEVTVNGLAGPSIGARTNARFTLAPASNKWWSLEGDLDVIGAFKLKLLGFDVAEVDGVLIDGPVLFQKDAGGPVTRGSGAPGGTPPGPMDPVEGDDVRWSRLATWDNWGPTTAMTARVAGTPEDVFVIFPSGVTHPPIMRVNGKGDPVWVKGGPGLALEQIASSPDGGFFLVSNFINRYLSRHDGQGNLIWSRAFNVREEDNSAKLFTITALLTTEPAPGQLHVHVIGYANNNATTLDADPVMLTFNGGDGTLIRSKRYDSDNMAEVTRKAIVSQEGKILICGTAQGPRAQIPPVEINAGSEYGALLMKLQPDGTPVSAERVRGSLEYHSLTEAPDGTLFAAGSFARSVILDDIPAFCIARYPPGTQAPPGFYGVGENIGKPGYTATLAPGGDLIPNAGITPWDVGVKLMWTPVGLVALTNTGLGVDTAVTAMCFTEKMSLRWWTTIENTTQEDTVFDALLTDDGIFTVGRTKSFGTAASGFYAAMINKLPLEGKIDLHPAFTGLSAYLKPGIMAVPHKGGLDPGIPHPDTGIDGIETIAFTMVDQPVALPADAVMPALGPITLTSWQSMEAGDAAAPMSYAQWAQFQQLPAGAAAPGANADDDQLTNFEEYYFGGDPWTPQRRKPDLGIFRRADGGITLRALRSRASRQTPFLLNFTNHPGSEPFQALGESALDWQTEAAAADDPASTLRHRLDLMPDAAPRRFFRLHYPTVTAP